MVRQQNQMEAIVALIETQVWDRLSCYQYHTDTTYVPSFLGPVHFGAFSFCNGKNSGDTSGTHDKTRTNLSWHNIDSHHEPLGQHVYPLRSRPTVVRDPCFWIHRHCVGKHHRRRHSAGN